MSNGVPVRLSEALTVRARTAAQVLDRSMTEQVEHWARLGQVVEDAIGAATVVRLKARSFDPELKQRLAVAGSAEGRAMAAALIRERNAVRHGIGDGGAIVSVAGASSRAKRAKPAR